MKRLIYQVYVGKRSKLYDHCTKSVAEYCERYSIDHKIQRTPILRIKPDVFSTNRSVESYEKYGGYLPIFEKENAFQYFNEYDQIAIIDSDIWFRPDCPDVFDYLSSQADCGFVMERQMPITDSYKAKIANYSRMQYGMPPINKLFDWNTSGADFYNMGMMVMNKSFAKYLKGETPRQFLDRPKFKPFIDGMGAWKWSTDQTLLNVWIKEEGMKVQNLNWKWNGLFTGIHMDKVKEAHFVHFFLKDKLPNRGEDVEKLMEQVNA